jgi:hypothetical protein
MIYDFDSKITKNRDSANTGRMKLISNCFEKQKSFNIQEQRGGVIFSIFLLRKYIFRYEHSFHTRQKEFQMSASQRTHLTLKNSTRAGPFGSTNLVFQRHGERSENFAAPPAPCLLCG